MKTVQLTARQTEVLRAMRAMQRSARKAPTQAKLAAALGIKQHTLSEHITNLALKGVVRKYGTSSRIAFYEIAKTKTSV
jgi:Mn-dependent DtxR family transcriptional regulator